jgi:hypothetical protein
MVAETVVLIIFENRKIISMKSFITYLLLSVSILSIFSCQKAINAIDGDYGNYPGGTISPYISILDIKNLYKGHDVTLSTENMLGSTSIAAVVVSDHRENNLPDGLLVVQDARRLSQLRGISIPLGADAAKYVTGDSVIIDVRGGVLKRVDGILQLTAITDEKIKKVSSGNPIPLNRVRSSDILADPDRYESVLSAIVKGVFVPIPKEGEKLRGEKSLNDGFGNITLFTENDASFADSIPYGLANYYGISFNRQVSADSIQPVFRVRKADDIVLLSSTITVAPIVIAGFMSDPTGGDGNYEYVQLLATKDINFAATPYSVVICNNATNTIPSPQGWATGVVVSGSTTYYRSYKFNLTTGTAKKGTYFYVGGSGKQINGPNSTSMSALNWIRAFNYSTTPGDGFGPPTSIFANSGNASGVAVFNGTTVTLASIPIDVIMVASGGQLLGAGNPPSWGYRIANTDWYDIRNPITLEEQPFYTMGTNTINIKYNTPADAGYYNILGGVYNTTLGRWTAARSQINMILSKTSPIDTIQGSLATKMAE